MFRKCEPTKNNWFKTDNLRKLTINGDFKNSESKIKMKKSSLKYINLEKSF